MPVLVATAKSGLPSPFRSPIATNAGESPVSNERNGAAKIEAALAAHGVSADASSGISAAAVGARVLTLTAQRAPAMNPASRWAMDSPPHTTSLPPEPAARHGNVAWAAPAARGGRVDAEQFQRAPVGVYYAVARLQSSRKTH